MHSLSGLVIQIL